MIHAHPITEQLTDLRRGAGVSRSVVAARVGVRTQHLRAWETGLYVPSTEGLVAWAAALGCALVVQPRSGLPMLGLTPVGALKQVRIRRGLSQADVAEDAGFTQSQLSQWERGGHSPGSRALGDWADTLGCDLTLAPAAVLAGVA
ncbi:helix-turn-helix domain-containing protein [Micromonosporaceae bacterium Da 78-11]